jgi:hypothetical protein
MIVCNLFPRFWLRTESFANGENCAQRLPEMLDNMQVHILHLPVYQCITRRTASKARQRNAALPRLACWSLTGLIRVCIFILFFFFVYARAISRKKD